MTQAIQLAEKGWLPEWLMRFGMRQLLQERLSQEASKSKAQQNDDKANYRLGPIAINTDEANEQHYAIPPDFFIKALGPRLKYSCCYWPEDVQTLEAAEQASLHQVAERAQLEGKQNILELGCGWGSFSLWAAQSFPQSQVTGVSNSSMQREHIMSEAKKRGLSNLNIITADINDFEIEQRFDRIVSIEMLEHVRNHPAIFERIATWLKDDGRFFAHVFSHKEYTYPFETKGDKDWMARFFFTGGIMPSHALFKSYNKHITVEEDWTVNGIHYQKTLDAWLHQTEAQKEEIIKIFNQCYGADEAIRWYHRWRMFFMACSELFGYKGGTEWAVSHYRFRKNG